jgi:hypothetical protein
LYSGLFILGSFGTSVLAFILFMRLRRGAATVRCTLSKARGDRFLDALATCVQTALDEDLPTTPLDEAGIETLELRYREPLDPYETVSELLAYVAQKGAPDQCFPMDAFIKATYQIGYTLDIPLTRLDACLRIAIDEMKRNAGPSIARIRAIEPGEMADAQTMVPLVPGQRVLYPLGVIAYDQDDKIVSRGKVLCG